MNSSCRLPLGAMVFLAALSSRVADAQMGMGITGMGAPFLFFAPDPVPSATDYLYDRERARISAIGNAMQQETASRPARAEAMRQRAAFNRIRDFTGADTYDVNSRQSLSARASTQRARPAASPAPEQPNALPLDAFFLPGGALDWPRDSPDGGALHSAKAEAESAIKAVREEVKAHGKPRAQSVGLAKSKLVDYGKYALAEVTSTRSETVGHLFHYFLLYLYDSLDQFAEFSGPQSAPSPAATK